jgi:hypothetical protein
LSVFVEEEKATISCALFVRYAAARSVRIPGILRTKRKGASREPGQRESRPKCAFSFPPDVCSALIIAQSHEAAVAKVRIRSPFDKFKLADEDRFEGGQAFVG